jgi:hypothetical protein
MTADDERLCRYLWSLRPLPIYELLRKVEAVVKMNGTILPSSSADERESIAGDMADIIRLHENYESFSAFYLPMVQEGRERRQRSERAIDKIAMDAGAKRTP